MTTKLPRLTSVVPDGPTTVTVTWDNGDVDSINLSGWIGTGGDLLAPLWDEAVFGTVRLGDYGASVDWGDNGGDLSIDAVHLSRIAEEQRDFGRVQFVQWQGALRLSNQEGADLLGIALSTFNLYRAGGPIPQQIAMLCRSTMRDPILMHAHFRPRKPGRLKRLLAKAP